MEKIIGKSKIKSFALLKIFKDNRPLFSSQFPLKRSSFLFSTPIRHFFSETKNEKNDTKFEFIANYHTLSKTLQSLKAPNEILELFKQNEKIFEKNNIVLALKMIARTIENRTDKEELKKNEVFAQLLNIIKDQIQNLEANELADVIFSIRKLKNYCPWLNIGNKEMKLLSEKINENLKLNKYTFKSLVNIHYDFSLLKISNDNLLEKISEEITASKSLLTLQVSLQLLQAFFMKSSFGLSFKEYGIISRLIFTIEEKYDELKIEQKSTLFKYIAKLELRYHPIKYDFPNFFTKLTRDIRNNLEKLNESLLISIISAYYFLPSFFPNDLLDDIKSVFIATLQESEDMVNSIFLIDFLENFKQIMTFNKRRSFKPEHMKVVVDFILKRLREKEKDMIETKSLNRLIILFENDHFVLKQIIDDFYLVCLEKIKESSKVFSATTLEILLNYQKDITPFLEEISKIIKKENFNIVFIIRIYLILSTQAQRSQPLEEYYQQCKEFVHDFLSKEPYKFLSCLKPSRLECQEKENLLMKAIPYLSRINPQEDYIKNSFLNSIIESCATKQMEIFWQDFFEKNKKKLNDEAISRFLDIYFSKNDFNENQISFLLKMITFENFRAESFKKLLNNLKKDSEFLKHLYKKGFSDMIIFVRKIFYLYTQYPQSAKASIFYSIAKKMDDLEFKSSELTAILADLFRFSLEMKSDKFLVRFIMDFIVNNEFSFSKLYPYLLDILKNDPNFISYDTKIEAMCKIVDDKKELIENHQNLFRKYINVVKQQMESNIFPKSFKAMKLALVLPTKFFLEEKNHLLRVLKQHSKNIFLKDLLGMFNALNSNTVHENFPDYEEIINELRIISENSEKKMGFNFSHFLQISTAVFKMPKTQMIQKFIDNLIHKICLSLQKRKIYPYSVISLLDLLNTTHIYNENLIKIISEKLCENPNIYKYYLADILDSFYELGANITLLDNLLKKVENEYFSQNPEILFKYLLCKATEENIDNEFDTLFNLLISTNQGFIAPSIEVIEDFSNFLSGLKKNYQSRFLSFLKKNDLSLENKIIKISLPSTHKKLLKEFLALIDENNLENILKDEFNLDFHDSEKKSYIVPIDESNYNLDKSERGKTKLLKKIFQSHLQEKIVFVNMFQFLSYVKPEEKIEYLINLGIECKKDIKDMDFLKIETTGINPKTAFFEKKDISQISEKLKANRCMV